MIDLIKYYYLFIGGYGEKKKRFTITESDIPYNVVYKILSYHPGLKMTDLFIQRNDKGYSISVFRNKKFYKIARIVEKPPT